MGRLQNQGRRISGTGNRIARQIPAWGENSHARAGHRARRLPKTAGRGDRAVMSPAVACRGILASCSDYVRVMNEQGILAAATQRAAERTATGPILAFDLVVIVGAVATFLLLKRWTTRLWLRAVVMATGVFLFELFTSPMWHNEH